MIAKNKQNKKSKKAFLLIEALTVLFIFALITVTFYSVFSVKFCGLMVFEALVGYAAARIIFASHSRALRIGAGRACGRPAGGRRARRARNS